jgi:FixJ family two-component response regulator
MTTVRPVVHVVDDDAPFLRSMLFALDGLGFDAVGHASPEEFLQARPQPHACGGCLLLDIRMPRLSGLALQRRLADDGSTWPVIFMTGHGDIDQAVQAMKLGAVDFLQKPFKEHALLEAVSRAVEIGLASQREHARRAESMELLARLSPREREVARHVALGRSNKEVGRVLQISENTVHVHRQRITEKTGSGHAADLARLLLRADPNALDG